MGRGLLEVLLVDAKGLAGTDFLGKIDPYVVVQYRSQERKSSTARGQSISAPANSSPPLSLVLFLVSIDRALLLISSQPATIACVLRS